MFGCSPLQRLSPDDHWIWETEQPPSQSFCPLEAYTTVELMPKEALIVIPAVRSPAMPDIILLSNFCGHIQFRGSFLQMYEGTGLDNPAELVVTICAASPLAVTPLPDRTDSRGGGGAAGAPPPPRLSQRAAVVCRGGSGEKLAGGRLLDRPVPQDRLQTKLGVAHLPGVRATARPHSMPAAGSGASGEGRGSGGDKSRSSSGSSGGGGGDGGGDGSSSPQPPPPRTRKPGSPPPDGGVADAGGGLDGAGTGAGQQSREVSRLRRLLAAAEQAGAELMADMSAGKIAAAAREAELGAQLEAAKQRVEVAAERMTEAVMEADTARMAEATLQHRVLQLQGAPAGLVGEVPSSLSGQSSDSAL